MRVLMAVLLFLTFAAWSMGSAVGSSPDEGYVLTSIWCADMPLRKGLGDLPQPAPPTETSPPVFSKGETCRLNPVKPGSVWLPSRVVEANCSRNSEFVSAECQKTLTDDLVSTDQVNSGLYPEPYLTVMHFTVGRDIFKSVIYMRLLNSLIASVLIIFALSLNKKTFTDLTFTFLSAIVPVGISLISSVNTSSWAITGSTIFVLSLLAVNHKYLKSRHNMICLFSALVGFWIANASRFETKYLLMLVIIIFVIYKFSDYFLLLQIQKKIAVLAIMSLIVVTLLSSLSVKWLFAVDAFGYQNKDPIVLLLLNLLNLPLFITGFFGSWGLNSFDVLLMQTVWLFATTSFLLIICNSLKHSKKQNQIIGLTLITIFCAAILISLQKFFVEIRDIVQPRYFFPMLIGASLLVTANKQSKFSNSLMISAGILATTANAIALRTVIRKYVSGPSVKITQSLNFPRDWWWTDKDSGTTLWAPEPEMVWLIGSLAFALLFAVIIYERKLESAETSKI